MKKSILTTALLGTLAFGVDVSNFDILGITLNHTSKQAMAIAQKQGYKCKDKGSYNKDSCIDGRCLASISGIIECKKKNTIASQNLNFWYDIRNDVIYSIDRTDFLEDRAPFDIDTFKDTFTKKYGEPEYKHIYTDSIYWAYGDCTLNQYNEIRYDEYSAKVFVIRTNTELRTYGMNLYNGITYNKLDKAQNILQKEFNNKQLQKTKEATSKIEM